MQEIYEQEREAGMVDFIIPQPMKQSQFTTE
jgi:hypothetical protein